MNGVSQTRLARFAEWFLLIAIVLIAIIFRFEQFGQVPPGLHYDEAIDAHLAQEIRSGAWPIYFEAGWGREPVYHYLVALTLNFVPDPASALRLVSGVLGLIQLVAAYFLFRRLFGVPTALIGAAWIAVLFWTVSTSRAGLRNITLTTFATLTALAFWWAWDKVQEARDKKQEARSQVQPPTSNLQLHPSSLIPHPSSLIPHPSSFILPGILLGLTLYTYQPGRVMPLAFLAFLFYLFVTNRSLVKAHWKSLAIFFIVAVVLCLPLGIFLATHPTAETGRAFQTEPIRAALNGDPSQMIETITATLKMFTFEGSGDPQPIYNISGRPLFLGLGAVLFYVGLLVCLARWRRPAYAFVLIWLIVALLPNMVTAPAPFFYRAIAAQTPALVMPAIGTVALGGFLSRKGREERGGKHTSWRSVRSWQFIASILIAVVSLGQTAWTTHHDYFEVWGLDPGVRFQYSAAHTAIARALDASPETAPVIISGDFTEDADPYIFEQTLHRHDLSIRWFDARSALVAVAGATQQRIALPAFAPLDGQLAARFLNGVAPMTRAKDFTLYVLNTASFRTEIERWGGQPQTPERQPAALPIAFDGNVSLIGYEQPVSVSRTDPGLTVLTAWRVTSEWQPSSTAIFVHLLDASGSLAAQDDRLGYPRHGWHPDDEFVQMHLISIAAVPPGRYTLQLGIYTRPEGTRWMAQDAAGKVVGDRVLLGQVEVK